jgi:hypothetical protein
VSIALTRREPAVIRERGWQAIAAAYPRWSEADLRQLLEESSWVYDFEAFTQLRIRARSGRFVTIDPAGFRHGRDQQPWPPRRDAFSVFVFGGSNALGSGLPDGETIPSRLQERLREVHPDAAVYNFGRSYFYSSQERILFQQLMLHGHVPNVALFLDGLNEFVYPGDEPQWTGALRNMISTRHQAMVDPARGLLSIVRWFARTVLRRVGRPATPPDTVGSTEGALSADRVVERWILNRRFIQLLAHDQGVRTLFAWQPVPMFGYDLALHAFVKTLPDFGPFQPTATGYEAMDTRRRSSDLGDDFLWLADMQRDASANLYVDNVHYNADFSAAIAGKLFEALRDRGLIARSSP